MRFTPFFAAAALALSANSALAWGDIYMGDGTNNPNSGQIYAYPTKANYCPAGLQPVVVGGVICCGTPTAPGYGDHTLAPKAVYKKKTYSAPAPRIYAPEGVKGVIYR
ncbi:hypothetical protein [Pseudoprimorskyibacter insulae]|uniref:Uncharacterized protein n=1 Tax=Pseudoprimorskyibacter insulae TaxID=1695997 RepID=A0A2R8APR1_9RHOB|nr:hypothetical protein [Pseudoprimorskyibacter insulae]SPF78068.1 hypothetical protein PRI8871_00657 [Pseudoprimorskyibacter insulae]